MIESASLETSKCVKALSGTGTEMVGLVLLDPDPDDPAAPGAPDGRDVPFTDVVALDETPVLVLVLDSTVAFDAEVDVDERAELGLTLTVDDVVFALAEDNADVEDAGVERLELVDTVSKAFPDEAPAPDPAPDDEPAVFDAIAVGAAEMELD